MVALTLATRRGFAATETLWRVSQRHEVVRPPFPRGKRGPVAKVTWGQRLHAAVPRGGSFSRGARGAGAECD